MITNTKNQSPLFKIGDKVKFGKRKGEIISEPIILYKKNFSTVYVVRFDEEIAYFEGEIPSHTYPYMYDIIISEDKIERQGYESISAGDIFFNKEGATVKLIQTPSGNFHLGGKNGNLDFLFSNEIFSKEEMLEKINKEEWVKKD